MTVEVLGEINPAFEEVLSPSALAFLEELHRRFNPQRLHLLQERNSLKYGLKRPMPLGFLKETEEVRQSSWSVTPVPSDLLDRRVEITGPTDRKMIINGLNSGARVFMADFEDANSPTWSNMIEGQINLTEAIEGTIRHEAQNGRIYTIGPNPAVLVVRPRGWHLVETHLRVDGEPLSASLVDFGLYVFHNHARLRVRHSNPYFYLPKLENYREAALWNAVFDASEELLNIPLDSIKATVLIETITAALEMEEILFVLRRHAVGLNAGRWDYLFSIIKKFREDPQAILPDRGQITMTVPFMRAYTDRLVQTCHKRGAHAIGGMAAFIPNRRDPEVNRAALERVREDKEREARDGFDGTWVAHPDLVSVAQEAFDRVLGSQPHQQHRRREDVHVTAAQLTTFQIPGGTITETGLRNNLSVAVQYLAAWLSGQGAVGLYNLMEDAATAEISRSQIHQWLHHQVVLADGTPLTRQRIEDLLAEEIARLNPPPSHLNEAVDLLRQVALQEEYIDFLTIPAYQQLTSLMTV